MYQSRRCVKSRSEKALTDQGHASNALTDQIERKTMNPPRTDDPSTDSEVRDRNVHTDGVEGRAAERSKRHTEGGV